MQKIKFNLKKNCRENQIKIVKKAKEIKEKKPYNANITLHYAAKSIDEEKLAQKSCFIKAWI